MMKPALKMVLVWGAALVLAGCGGSDGGLERVIVKGQVTYQGVPVENGEIRFIPEPGTQGPVSGAPIKDGKYIVKARGGVPVGKHTVRFEAFRAPEGAREAEGVDLPTGDLPPREQYLPEEFNRQSQIQVTIESDREDVEKDFEL